MDQQIISADYFYFGKCPARGDFVRSQGQHAMIKVLDEWAANSLDQLQASGAGFTAYDQMAGISFAFCNPKVPVALVGFLQRSQDASQRRYPLITGYRLQLKHPEQFVSVAPLHVSALWLDAQIRGRKTIDAQNAGQIISVLEQSGINTAAHSYEPHLLSDHTINSFASLLKTSQYKLVQSLIALGLLLQPIVSQGAKQLNKVLILPLAEGAYTNHVAAFWLDLISGFIKRHNLDLSIMIWHQPQPILLVGFQGADILALTNMMQNNMAHDHWVHLSESAWVDHYLEHDAGLATFEQVLSDSYISLYEATKLFKQIFLGQ